MNCIDFILHYLEKNTFSVHVAWSIIEYENIYMYFPVATYHVVWMYFNISIDAKYFTQDDSTP